MNKIRIIAQREFVVTVARKGYIISVLGMPVFFGMIFGLNWLTRGSVEKSFKATGPIALLDRSHVADLSLAAELAARANAADKVDAKESAPPVQRLVAYNDLDRALNDLKQGRVSACYVLESDYLATGMITVYTPEGGMFSDLAPPDWSQLRDVLRASLLKDYLRGERMNRAVYVGTLEQMKVTKQGEVKPAGGEAQKFGKFIGPFAMFILLTMSIFFSAGYLLQGIVEEKQNRVIEIILSSVKPTELLTGKIIGLGAAGLLQVIIYLTFLLVPATALFAMFQVSMSSILFSVIYFVLGYLLFAGLMAGTGILGNSPQESQQLSVIWTLTSMIPMFLLAPLSESPNSWFSRALSFFPLTAPVTMLLRLSTTRVPVWDIVISISMLVVGICLAIKGASKIFRTAALMTGKRPSLPEILRWLKEA